jgi:type IV secretion system protein VirB2
MTNTSRAHFRHLAAAACAALVCAAGRCAFAASAGMPWEGPLQQIVASLTGPVAKAIGVAAIVITGLGMAISEGGHGHRKIIGLILGLSIVFTAGNFILPFLGFSGGLAP